MLVCLYLLYCMREIFCDVLLILVAVEEGIGIKPVVPSESKLTEKAVPVLFKESSVDPDPQP